MVGAICNELCDELCDELCPALLTLQTPVAGSLGPSIQGARGSWRLFRQREGQPAAKVENWGPLPSLSNEVVGWMADLEEPDRPSGKVAGLLAVVVSKLQGQPAITDVQRTRKSVPAFNVLTTQPHPHTF